MPITDEVVKAICQGESRGEPTSRTAHTIAETLLKYLQTRLDLELESIANTTVAIDFDGSLKEMDRFRKAIARTRERIKKWSQHEALMIKEGFH